MSDVSVAPDASPPPSSSGVTDVPVHQAPVNIPNPISSQAPSKPPDADATEHRPQSRREAIADAYKRYEKARGEVKPAEAKVGHNQPPEPTPKEKPTAAAQERPRGGDPDKPTIDLRRPPSDQPKAEEEEKPKDDRPRGEHGHFAPRQASQASQASQPSQVPQLPPTAQWREPLSRMSREAKAEWANTPESVRADIHRMNGDFARAYQTYRDDHEEMNALRPFQQLAREHNTNLSTVLNSYRTMEVKLREDPIGAMDLLVDNLNLRYPDGSPEGRKLTLLDLCWHVVNQTPEQRQMVQQRNAAAALQHQLRATQQRLAHLEERDRQVQYREVYTQTRGAVEEYAQAHPRIDELGPGIVQEINLGFPLDEAYRRANLLYPANTAAQTRADGTAPQTRTHTAQTRTPDRSISGAPGGPSNGTGARQHRQPVSRRDALQNAFKSVNGSL